MIQTFIKKKIYWDWGSNLNHPGGVPGGVKEEGREVSLSGGEAPIRRDDDWWLYQLRGENLEKKAFLAVTLVFGILEERGPFQASRIDNPVLQKNLHGSIQRLFLKV